MDKSASKRPKVGQETPERPSSKKRRQQEPEQKEARKDAPPEPVEKKTPPAEESAEEQPQSSEASQAKEVPEKEPETTTAKTSEESEGQIPFRVHRVGSMEAFLEQQSEEVQAKFKQEIKLMENAIDDLEETGASSPFNGKMTANVAFRLKADDSQEIFVVLRSGINENNTFDWSKDVCLVTKFDPKNWSAEFMSHSDEALPTPDTPMYWAAFKSNLKYKWSEAPDAILHGHSLESEEVAEKLGLPITEEPALASTPTDTQAVMALYEKHPYPKHKVFVRKGHGFLLLAQNLKAALEEFEKSIVPNI